LDRGSKGFRVHTHVAFFAATEPARATTKRFAPNPTRALLKRYSVNHCTSIICENNASTFAHYTCTQPRSNNTDIQIMPKYTLWNNDVDIDIPKTAFPTDEELKDREAMFPCEHGWFKSPSSGAQLHYRAFLPSNSGKQPKGVVVFHHGVQGQSGRGFILKNGRKVAVLALVEKLTGAGYAVYALDAYGHGFSEGTRFYVPDWRNNRDDFEHLAKAIVAEQHADTPLFLMGESYGGCLALHVASVWEDAAKAPKTYKGIILCAPAVVGDLPPKPVVWTLRYGLAPLFPKWVPFFMPNTVGPERIWSDPEVRGLFTDKRFFEMSLEGCGRAFRLGTALQMLVALEDVRTNAVPSITKPFCVCHGKADASVLIEGSEFLLEHAKTPSEDRAVIFQEGAFHDLFSEPSADEVLEFILKFLNERVKQ